jgi:hypothetical protein
MTRWTVKLCADRALVAAPLNVAIDFTVAEAGSVKGMLYCCVVPWPGEGMLLSVVQNIAAPVVASLIEMGCVVEILPPFGVITGVCTWVAGGVEANVQVSIFWLAVNPPVPAVKPA